MNNGFKTLKVYQVAYKLAMEIFNVSKSFPQVEVYSLTEQIRRSSRSVCTNIGEAYRKRIYCKHFVTKISDADGECSETLIWLDFAKDCGNIPEETHTKLYKEYEEVGKMLGNMGRNPEKFIPRN